MQQEDLVSTAIVFHKRLNPRLWSQGHLKKEVRFHLLEIAQHFIDFIGIEPLGLQDITISGSNAGYTFSRNSDLDLHLVVDIPKERERLMKQLFDAKKNQYNFQHNIKLKGIHTEVYVQDSKQVHHSVGVYSVLDDKWLKIPERKEDTLDRAAIKVKYKHFLGLVRSALRSDNLQASLEVMESIKRLRQQGLDREGELSVENITFKVLRSKGYIDQLREHISILKANKLSLETNNEN